MQITFVLPREFRKAAFAPIVEPAVETARNYEEAFLGPTQVFAERLERCFEFVLPLAPCLPSARPKQSCSTSRHAPLVIFPGLFQLD